MLPPCFNVSLSRVKALYMKVYKLFLSLLVLGMLFSACGKQEKKAFLPQEEETADSLVTDSLQVETTDSVSVEALPQKADELFDDFVFAFMKNKHFQKARILFPLPYQVNGKKQKIKAASWKFDPMYAKQENYTLLLDSRREEEKAKDTAIHHVVVEEFNLRTERIKKYIFQRKSSTWKLTEVIEGEVEESQNKDFYVFYRTFVSDKAFQQEHIANPLQFSTYDEDSFEKIKGFISSDQWNDFAPELPQNQLTNVLYGQQHKKSQLKILKISSLSGGLNSTLTFKRNNGKWTLIQLEN
ncbi:DUF4348 domain-containing protein [Alloprevotella sp. OH1205_COT-284]|nr:DUF4348 domain-containing protein [Alloprevotella sp. OH1205_COT-284]